MTTVEPRSPDVSLEAWSLAEEARRLGISLTLLKSLVKRHRIHVLQAGRRRLFDTAAHLELMRWLAAHNIVRAARRPETMIGVYFLIKDDEIVYVGQSMHVERRLLRHMQKWKFDKWHWIECKREERRDLELDFIRVMQPAWNKLGLR